MSSNGKIPGTVNQIKIFSRDYPLLSKLIFFALACHIVSFGSEYIGFVSYLDDFFTSYISEKYANPIAHIVSAALALLLEFLFAVLIIFVCRCCLDPTYVKKSVILKNLQKDWQKKEDQISLLRTGGQEVDDQTHNKSDLPGVAKAIHVANIIKLVFASILLVGFTVLSMTVSRTNIEIATLVDQGEAKQKDDSKVLADKAAALLKVDDRYDQQIVELQASYQRDTAAIGLKYIGEIKRQQGKAEEYAQRGQRDGKNYGTAIARTGQAIGKQLSKKGPEIDQRSKKLSQDLVALNVQREAERKKVSGPYDLKLQNINTFNEEMRRLKARQNAWMSGFLKHYAQFATIGQLVAWIWITLSRFTSGIEPTPRVKPEMVSTTLFQDLYTLITVGPSRRIHNIVRKQLSKIRLLRPMPYRGADYEFETLKAIQTIQEKMEKTNSLEMLESEIESIKKGYHSELTKRRNSTRRKGRGFGFLRLFSTLFEGVENQSVEDVETKDVEDVEKDLSTVEKELLESVETKSVEDLERSVATRFKGQGRGVEGQSVEDVETKGVEDAVEGESPSDSTPEKSVETKGVESVGTKRRKGVEKPRSGKRRNSTENTDSTPSTDGMEVYQGLEATVEAEGNEIPIRLLVMGTEVFADWYGTPRTEQWVKKERSNYQRFLDKGKRNTPNTREKLAVALGLLQLFQQHRQKLSNQEIVVSKK
ncbi:MAG: hypothetical protein HRU41_24540 [Saprospiraceae bacterium]|nr:hypothetical protein [Saprospiraceae bacterium]